MSGVDDEVVDGSRLVVTDVPDVTDVLDVVVVPDGGAVVELPGVVVVEAPGVVVVVEDTDLAVNAAAFCTLANALLMRS